MTRFQLFKRYSKTNILRTGLLFILFIFSFSNVYAEKITDRDFGFSLDIPEGFEIADYTEDGMSYVFSHPNIPVTLVMK